MPYGSVINRATPGGSPLINERVMREIVAPDVEKSAAMSLLKTVDMGTNQTRIPVMASYPLAYWITGSALADRDVGLKQTTTMTWDNVYLNAEELAVIVPIPINLIRDTSIDLWAQIKPRVREAIAIALDDAIFFGTNAPATFPTAIVPAAVAASNQVIAGTSTIDVLDDINEVMRLVENDGYDVTGFWGRAQLRGKLRGMRSTTKELLFVPDNGTPANVGMSGTTRGTLFNEPIVFSKAGFTSFATGAANYSLIAGQWDQAILGVRQDIEMETFREGVITDAEGNIVHNLMQQDMQALRVTYRAGFAVPNPINRMNQTAGTRYPFAVLKQNAGGTGE
jgi:HK97 family phage major capsid protein